MKKRIVITLTVVICSVFALGAYSQKNYALSAKGDTLRGGIRISSFDNLDRINILGADGKKTTYTCLQIRYFILDGDTYRPLRLENAIRFGKMIREGYLNLCAFNSTNVGTWDGRYLYKKDGTGMELPNLNFKNLLKKYLSDCEDVSTKISNGDLTKRDIEKIVELYNACLQAKTNALTSNDVPTVSVDSEKALALKKFTEKVGAENFVTKKDVLDLLKDIDAKVSKQQIIPNYLTDGLKSYLSDTPALLKEAEDLIALLKK